MKALAPVFTAVLTLGFAACIAGRPYVGEEARGLLLPLLGISALVGMCRLRDGAACASWAFLAMFFVGALTDLPEGRCRCESGPPPPEHFPTLIIALFIGSFAVYLLARRPAPIRIVRARARLPPPGRVAEEMVTYQPRLP